jgi:putative oxidoreductase
LPLKKESQVSLLLNCYHLINQKLSASTDGVVLLIRLWIAKVFFLSGLTKIANWDTTLMLFEYEYSLPLLPVALSAFLATFFELVMPVLLSLGLFTRFAAAPLLVMTAVIELTYGSFSEHAYWGLLLGLLMTYGAGKLSLDHYFALKINQLR